jgi:hypothetical protein
VRAAAFEKRIAACVPVGLVVDLASRIECPLLVIYGEAELAENKAGSLVLSTMKFLNRIKAPVAVHEFAYEEGRAATHCQVGAEIALRDLMLDWLDRVIVKGEDMSTLPELTWKTVLRHHGRNREIVKLPPRVHVAAFEASA